MTYILPGMTLACLLLIDLPLAAAEGGSPEVIDGNQLVAAAVNGLLQQTSLEAKVRQRASIFGQLATGSGLYAQTRDSDLLRVRFEFKLQVADKSLTLLHVNDGSTLWIRRDDGANQTQAYINLRRISDAARQKLKQAAPGLNLDPGQLAVGGLAQLLASLGDHFEFGAATSAEISGIPMWELTGEWKQDQLARLLPGQRDQILAGQPADLSQLPAHVPTTVKLTLGRDRHFPLFPYRFEYGRLQSGSVSAQQEPLNPATIRPLVTMELYEVRRPNDLLPDLFAYPIGDQNVEDRTETYLQQLGLMEGPP